MCIYVCIHIGVCACMYNHIPWMLYVLVQIFYKHYASVCTLSKIVCTLSKIVFMYLLMYCNIYLFFCFNLFVNKWLYYYYYYYYLHGIPVSSEISCPRFLHTCIKTKFPIHLFQVVVTS